MKPPIDDELVERCARAGYAAAPQAAQYPWERLSRHTWTKHFFRAVARAVLTEAVTPQGTP